MPYAIDDILLNLEESRAKAIMKALAEPSRKTEAILFYTPLVRGRSG
jgi:uncharacterized protein YhaN